MRENKRVLTCKSNGKTNKKNYSAHVATHRQTCVTPERHDQNDVHDMTL